MSAPLVVNTKDGVCWTRRVVTSGGIALYAPESVKTCPDFVMATEAELAELGIVGSAYALPMPVAEAPQMSASSKVVRIVAEVSGTESLEDAQYAESRVEYTLEEHGYEAQVWIDTGGEHVELSALRARVAELEALTAQATEFRLWEPGYGLYVRRAPGTPGFAVMEARRTDKGRRCWTTAGWQYAAVLSDTELFCWPDAQTAVAEARRVMPGATVREEPEGGGA